MTVSFEAGPVAVREGETAEVRVRYQVRDLAAPWQLAISTLPVTASPDDFELSAASIEIPAGQGISGESSLELLAVADVQFDEGEETVAVRLVPGGGVNAQLGADLQIRIDDRGVSPCAALRVVATPPAPGGNADVYVERSFTFQVAEGSTSLGMDFVEPYLAAPDSVVDGLPGKNTNFALNVERWEMAAADRGITHTVDIQMRHGMLEDPDLELAFHGDGCDGAEVACSVEKCELMEAD